MTFSSGEEEGGVGTGQAALRYVSLDVQYSVTSRSDEAGWKLVRIVGRRLRGSVTAHLLLT